MNMEVAVFVLTNEELLKILPILMPSTSGPSSSLELRLFNPEDEDNKIFRTSVTLHTSTRCYVPNDLDVPP